MTFYFPLATVSHLKIMLLLIGPQIAIVENLNDIKIYVALPIFVSIYALHALRFLRCWRRAKKWNLSATLLMTEVKCLI